MQAVGINHIHILRQTIFLKAPNNKGNKQQKQQTTKAINNKSTNQQKHQTTKALNNKSIKQQKQFNTKTNPPPTPIFLSEIQPPPTLPPDLNFLTRLRVHFVELFQRLLVRATRLRVCERELGRLRIAAVRRRAEPQPDPLRGVLGRRTEGRCGTGERGWWRRGHGLRWPEERRRPGERGWGRERRRRDDRRRRRPLRRLERRGRADRRG